MSLATLIGFPIVLFALLVAASYPLAAVAAAVTVALAAKVGQLALSAVVRWTGESPRHVTVPGVGTVTFSVSPA